MQTQEHGETEALWTEPVGGPWTSRWWCNGRITALFIEV